MKEQVELLASATDNEFLEAFAKKVELVDVLAITDPNALLIESTQLSERIEKDELVIKYKLSNGKLITVSNRVKNKLFQEIFFSFQL